MWNNLKTIMVSFSNASISSILYISKRNEEKIEIRDSNSPFFFSLINSLVYLSGYILNTISIYNSKRKQAFTQLRNSLSLLSSFNEEKHNQILFYLL